MAVRRLWQFADWPYAPGCRSGSPGQFVRKPQPFRDPARHTTVARVVRAFDNPLAEQAAIAGAAISVEVYGITRDWATN